jgi:fructose-specific phosphotransferase system IIC component
MPGPSLSLAKLARASAVHVGVAFLAMGGWALYANRTHGSAAFLPALVQGAISGAITFGLKRVLEAMARRLSGATAYVVPPLITASVILALLIGVHRLIGTPEIAATIAVPWSVSTLYAIIYAAALARGAHARSR